MSNENEKAYGGTYLGSYSDVASGKASGDTQESPAQGDFVPQRDCTCPRCEQVFHPKRVELRESAAFAETQAGLLADRARRNTRAVELLTKHPEFEEFLELLSIVKVEFIKS